MNKIIYIVVHCSDSPFGNASLITKWHLEKGWSGIGYHYVLLNGKLGSKIFNSKFDGHIETGRPLNNDEWIEDNEIGSHVLGHNKDSIGICLIGNSGNFTTMQLLSLESLIADIKRDLSNGTKIQVVGHCDLDPSGKPHCPGFNVKKWAKEKNL